MVAGFVRETDLYPFVKALLEGQGYTVKAEIGAADVMALRDDEEPVIVEMKIGFSLTLFHQAIERQRITEAVYIAVPLGKIGTIRRNLALCRRLGLGLITVRASDGHTEVHADPGPYRPRPDLKRKRGLLKEFARRSGDPNLGGTRGRRMTAYRQDALRCLAFLADNGASRACDVAKALSLPTARRIMADNHYGWFDREARGIYGLSGNGRSEAGKKESSP